VERTLILLKPDAVQRRLSGQILGRFEAKGLKVVGLKLARLPRALVEKHYEAHREKPFYGDLVRFMTGGPVVVMALEGPRAVEVCRRLMGKTFGHEAEPGTIRGDYGISSQFNLVHGSDSPQAAERELELFFEPDELQSYDMIDDAWLE
jgi:nucleoside-diphosphate kinase